MAGPVCHQNCTRPGALDELTFGSSAAQDRCSTSLIDAGDAKRSFSTTELIPRLLRVNPPWVQILEGGERLGDSANIVSAAI